MIPVAQSKSSAFNGNREKTFISHPAQRHAITILANNQRFIDSYATAGIHTGGGKSAYLGVIVANFRQRKQLLENHILMGKIAGCRLKQIVIFIEQCNIGTAAPDDGLDDIATCLQFLS